MEPVWKITEVVMNNRLKCLDYHDCLHGFLAVRDTGTATTEVELVRHLAYIKQVPLYGVFIDFRNAYNVMDRGRYLEILQAYDVGAKMLKVIGYFWTTLCWYFAQEVVMGSRSGQGEK